MTYNIHPIIVHFPIALLFLYAVIKILPLSKWLPDISWKQIERVILAVGVASALMAYATGDTAREMLEPNRQLVHAHENFAFISIMIFSLLLFGEFVSLVKSNYGYKINNTQITQAMNMIGKILCNNMFSKLLAFLGLITITVTGMLGGVMIYKLTADPLAGIVLRILGISL